MTRLPTALQEYIGLDKTEIDTPALLIDLDMLEKNIKTIADHYAQKKEAALKPHQKGHRSPMIARKQLDAGAKGVSMTSFGLVELYLNSGIRDILVTSEIYGSNKILRLCGLSKRGEITVGVDNIENVRTLSNAALSNNTKINVAVELFMGQGSCGIEIGKACNFIKKILQYKGVEFKGVWWHDGSLGNISSWDERREVHFKTLNKVAELKAEIESVGVEVQMISGGYTCTWNMTPEYEKLSNVEVQAGNYVFSDWVDRLLEGQEMFDCALTVLTRCISRPAPNQAMFDSGMNTCSDEAGGAIKGGYNSIVGPKMKDVEGIVRIQQREEIMLAIFEEGKTGIRTGDVIELIPPHADTTAKLHDKYYGVRNGKVELVWPNYGRGLF